MKKTLLPFLIASTILIFQVNCFAQRSSPNGMLQLYTGYGQTAYNMYGYDAASYVPVGLRAAIGVAGLSLGADWWTDVVDPKFTVGDSLGNTLWKERISNNYIGAMIRAQMADDPRDFAVILRAGVGVFMSKRAVALSSGYHGPEPGGDTKFANSIGYCAGLGFSMPFRESKTHAPSNIHFTLEGQFNYNPRKYNGTTNYHTSWGIQVGISYNFFNSYNLGHY